MADLSILHLVYLQFCTETQPIKNHMPVQTHRIKEYDIVQRKGADLYVLT